MSVIILLVIIGVIVAGIFLIGFIWAVKSGQYDDMYSPSVRILFDDPKNELDENKSDNTENNSVNSEEKDTKSTNTNNN